ncbi:hypothetical protein H9Q10_01830 [Eikenella sp. S3360]|uniref:Uncharacterized protein n=1 Tax=Eikenella glucosivorans TaxID=2766967 RepID=A0ABS0N809_9NEIS|nr:hypothetical protein [Eikenella glucosivorans]MBH5328411.1 hypothetical protein [Eikenella glucosivorans]
MSFNEVKTSEVRFAKTQHSEVSAKLKMDCVFQVAFNHVHIKKGYPPQAYDAVPPLLAQPNGAQFFGKQGHALSEAAQPQVRARPKTVRSEGNLCSKPVPAVAFLCFLFLAKQRKEGSARAGIRRKSEQNKNSKRLPENGQTSRNPMPFPIKQGYSQRFALAQSQPAIRRLACQPASQPDGHRCIIPPLPLSIPLGK